MLNKLNDFQRKIISENGISYFNSFEYYRTNGCKEILKQKGVYIVCMPDHFIREFRPDTDGPDTYNGQNLVVAIDILKENWVEGSRILYIGKAGGEENTLRKRIRQYMRYGYYKEDVTAGLRGGTNHRGGRYIWQLKNNKQLLIGYFLSDEPENLESHLIKQFKDYYNKRPFANLKD